MSYHTQNGMNPRLKTLLVYLAIGLLPVAASFMPSVVRTASSSSGVTQAISFAPLAIFALIGFLGLWLNQTRILWISLLLALLHALLLWPQELIPNPAVRRTVMQIACMGMPLSFLLVALGRESPLWDNRGLTRALLGLLPFVCLGVVSAAAPGLFMKIAGWNVIGLGRRLAVPQLALLGWLAFCIFAAVSPDRRIRHFLRGLCVASLPILFAGHVSLGKNPAAHFLAGVALSAACAILLHAIFAMYWQRVYVDELTEIPNRRSLDERLHGLAGQYALAMVDVDHFKEFNDSYGHHEGDNVLRLVAKHLSDEFPGAVFRYGGEEFCALFPGTDAAGAFSLMERARLGLARREFHIRSGPPRRRRDRGKPGGSPRRRRGDKVSITMSAGIATSAGGERESGEVIRRADAALYRAKDSGRNRVIAT